MASSTYDNNEQGLIIATCTTCGADLQSDMLCELQHEADGTHTVIHGEKLEGE